MATSVRLTKTTKFGVLQLNDSSINPVTSRVEQKKGGSKPETTTTSNAVSAPIVDIEQLILTTLSTKDAIDDSFYFSQEIQQDHQLVVGAIKALLPEAYVKDELITTEYYELTDEGKDTLAHGSPEFRVFSSIPLDGGLNVNQLQANLGEIGKVGLGKCLQNKWVQKSGDNIVRVQENVTDDIVAVLSQLSTIKDEKELTNLKKRKLIQQIKRKSYKVTKGTQYLPKRVKRLADLTKDMLGNVNEVEENSNHWTTLAFKSVNLNSMGANVTGGNFHPLLKVRAEFRRILMDMGFEEMPTNKWVESSFWNFDSLFQPQSHPARDAHDTFFIKDPQATQFDKLPLDYYNTVKNTHEVGGYGSIGYGCVFKKDESMKNLLRTHTTAISAQMLYKLANQPGGFIPKKYFSIDRVFRNEAMDATHLCEFHQVEGFVADRNLTLGHLIFIIRTFFEKIGITEIRFKPAYNPYTEPSMEVFGYHPELKKWTELGNSGMFRPEMLRPMGLPEDVRVIAWGLSLERPTMIKYRIENIRDLFGHKADLLQQRNAPIALF